MKKLLITFILNVCMISSIYAYQDWTFGSTPKLTTSTNYISSDFNEVIKITATPFQVRARDNGNYHNKPSTCTAKYHFYSKVNNGEFNLLFNDTKTINPCGNYNCDYNFTSYLWYSPYLDKC